MTWLTKQAQKLEHVWEISPVVCKAAFLAAKRRGQYGIVFCSLWWELPVVQKPEIVMLLWTFSCHRLAYFEAFITLLVHLSQASSSSQRAILSICEHLSGVLGWIPTQCNEASTISSTAASPLVGLGSVAGKKKETGYLCGWVFPTL